MTDATPAVDPLVDLLIDGLRYGDNGLTFDAKAPPRFLAEARKIGDRARFREVIEDMVHLAYFLAEKRQQPEAGDEVLGLAVALMPTLSKLLGADAAGDWSKVRKHLIEHERAHNPTTADAIQAPTGAGAGLKPNRGNP